MFYVYILSSRSRVLYVGVTNNMARRLAEHRAGIGSSFTRRYHVHRLVHLEPHESVCQAVTREKQLKGWRRDRKVALIEAANPLWLDLSVHDA